MRWTSSQYYALGEVNHWLASLEGVVGVLFVALATVTHARKAIRD
jgi:hypothetical protein